MPFVAPNVIRSADGGTAQLVGQILALVLPEFSTTGLFLTAGGQSMRLFAKLSTVVQDLVGLRVHRSHDVHCYKGGHRL